MIVYLIRHTSAGDRSEWKPLARERGLEVEPVEALARAPIPLPRSSSLSAPVIRCRLSCTATSSRLLTGRNEPKGATTVLELDATSRVLERLPPPS